MKTLSILIPTFNRGAKVIRLLNKLADVVQKSNINIIDVLVSNNASNDNTKLLLADYKNPYINLQIFNQTENLKFDGNIKFLYEISNTNYVWFISDDDIPIDGCLNKVLNAINHKDEPDLVIASHIQPPGSKFKLFNYEDEVYIERDKQKIIRNTWNTMKISVWIYKKIELDTFNRNLFNEFFWHSGFFFISIAHTNFSQVNEPTLAIISEPLVTVDDEYTSFFFSPELFLKAERVLNHPYTADIDPNFLKEVRKRNINAVIDFLYAINIGLFKSTELVKSCRQVLIDSNINYLKLDFKRILKAFFILCNIKVHNNSRLKSVNKT